MVQTIINPNTGRPVNAYGAVGRQILSNYSSQYGGGRKSKGRSKGKSKGRSKGKSKGRPRKTKSAAKSRAGKSNPWIRAVKKARSELGITGFQVIKRGSRLHTLAKKYHNQMKR